MDYLSNPRALEPCVVVLGMFDGVHRGHQALLVKGRELADRAGVPLAVCTFEPHPLRVLCPERAPGRLTTQAERAQWMALCGADRLCVHPFTRKLAKLPPETFLQQVVDIYHPVAMVCGFNFTFGRRGEGSGELLQRWMQARGIAAEIIPAVQVEGQTVSSTHIRQLLRVGDVRGAARMLGHAYTLAGTVENGKHVGRTLGFPTANVKVHPEKELPAYGVYACYATVQGESHPAVVNIGRHPTLPEGPATIEAHLLDGHPDLYGRNMRLTLMHFQRGEIRFASVEALREQIARDKEEAQAFFEHLR